MRKLGTLLLAIASLGMTFGLTGCGGDASASKEEEAKFKNPQNLTPPPADAMAPPKGKAFIGEPTGTPVPSGGGQAPGGPPPQAVPGGGGAAPSGN